MEHPIVLIKDYMRHRNPNRKSKPYSGIWERFDSLRTKESGGDFSLLVGNRTSFAIAAPCTHREVVVAIATHSKRPVPIHSLADDLGGKELLRGKTTFGLAGDAIDEIALNYEGMYWWISKEGLNMAILSPAAARLSRFDEFAGKLYVDRSKEGRLYKEVLMSIAKDLDAAGFTLKELQPSQWEPISKHNQKCSKQAIKTFEQACRHGAHVRSVRRRLYVARDRYKRANPTSSQPSRVS